MLGVLLIDICVTDSCDGLLVEVGGTVGVIDCSVVNVLVRRWILPYRRVDVVVVSVSGVLKIKSIFEFSTVDSAGSFSDSVVGLEVVGRRRLIV